MKRIVRTTIIALTSLVGLTLLGWSLLQSQVNPSAFQALIAHGCESTLGQSCRLQGDVHWSFFPWTGLILDDLESQSKTLNVTVRHTAVKIDLGPLFWGKIRISGLRLSGIHIQGNPPIHPWIQSISQWTPARLHQCASQLPWPNQAILNNDVDLELHDVAFGQHHIHLSANLASLHHPFTLHLQLTSPHQHAQHDITSLVSLTDGIQHFHNTRIHSQWMLGEQSLTALASANLRYLQDSNTMVFHDFEANLLGNHFLANFQWQIDTHALSGQMNILPSSPNLITQPLSKRWKPLEWLKDWNQLSGFLKATGHVLTGKGIFNQTPFSLRADLDHHHVDLVLEHADLSNIIKSITPQWLNALPSWPPLPSFPHDWTLHLTIPSLKLAYSTTQATLHLSSDKPNASITWPDRAQLNALIWHDDDALHMKAHYHGLTQTLNTDLFPSFPLPIHGPGKLSLRARTRGESLSEWLHQLQLRWSWSLQRAQLNHASMAHPLHFKQAQMQGTLQHAHLRILNARFLSRSQQLIVKGLVDLPSQGITLAASLSRPDHATQHWRLLGTWSQPTAVTLSHD